MIKLTNLLTYCSESIQCFYKKIKAMNHDGEIYKRVGPATMLVLLLFICMNTCALSGVRKCEQYAPPADTMVQSMIASYCSNLTKLINDHGLQYVSWVWIWDSHEGKKYEGYWTYQYDIVVDFLGKNDSMKGYYTTFFFYKRDDIWVMFQDENLELWESKLLRLPDNIQKENRRE